MNAQYPGRDVQITLDNVTLDGILALPARPRGLVIFAHGSGSSRFSSRNQAVAARLRDGGLATLLFDLLSVEEEQVDVRTRALRFDIPMLASRLHRVARWARQQDELAQLAIGYFGSSTGGGAALVADAEEPGLASAVVSRGGRPDLAGAALPKVQAATLLVVGGRDEQVIEMNEEAKAQMRAAVRLEIVPAATHLFEEPGTLEQVSVLAADWFGEHLVQQTRTAR